MLREEIKNLIKEAMRKLDLPEIEIHLEHPEDSAHGDFATNVAMQLAKTVKKNPRVVADLIVDRLIGETRDKFEKIEVDGPGFINFFLKPEVLYKELADVLKARENYGGLRTGKDKKANVEFISANPTGPLHIGNGRGAFFGDTLSNVLEKVGYKVTREYYIQDSKRSTQIKELGRTVLGQGIAYKTPYLEEKIKRFSGSTIQRFDDTAEAGYIIAQEIHRETQDFIEGKLKIKFDNWVSEEELYEGDHVDKIYNLLKKKKLVYKKEGAEWFEATKLGASQDYVLVRKTGEPTYLLPDLAYHDYKFSRKFSKIINIWGADHQGHVDKMKAALKIFYPEPACPELHRRVERVGGKMPIEFLITQMVRLKGAAKLSKRKGEIITLEWLIDEVGLDAARFLYLMRSIDTQMEFDVELAKEKSEKNPVYYVQYAHARISSILHRTGSDPVLARTGSDPVLLTHPSELGLIRELIKFPEIVEDTARDYQVQRLPHYAIKIADLFHRFYHDCRVLSEDKDLTQARLGLILATKNVFKNVLNLMGISAPKKM